MNFFNDEEPAIITLDEMAQKLQVSVHTINRLRASGELPARFFLRVGRRVRFSWRFRLEHFREESVNIRTERKSDHAD